MDKLDLDEVIVAPGAGCRISHRLRPRRSPTRPRWSFFTTTEAFDDAGAHGAHRTGRRSLVVRRACARSAAIEPVVHMRYRGQGWEIPVPLGDIAAARCRAVPSP
ncbi:MAG: hypothetical protein R2695_10145 [Acidimicrobiales bacterium]